VITQNLCLWKYRSSECGYVGAPIFDSRDQTISTTGQTAQGIAVINAWSLREQRKAELQSATQAYNQSLGAQEATCASFALLETNYKVTGAPLNFVSRNADGDELSDRYSAVFNNIGVVLSESYRQGRQRETTYATGDFYSEQRYFYEIERWGIDAVGCANAGAAVAAAAAALGTAQSNLNNAEAALSAALSALPANDPLRLSDVCGKRVSSCALRFPEQSLPFGGFPGANLTRS
jgi:hypothetical protein